MAKSVTLYNLLISCPGDVKEEIPLIESVVAKFNEMYTDPLGITIQTKHWKKSSYSQSGGKPQVLLNEQFVDKCDAAVAIFWTRFGTPTDEYGSGTEEEIEIMLRSGKQVFMYFSDKPIPPSQMNEDGYKKVQTFREKYSDKGIYHTYSSNDEFEKMFFAHLSSHFLSVEKLKEVANERISELRLMGINQYGKLCDDASIYPFVLNTDTTMEKHLDTIRTLYQKISEINVGKRRSSSSYHVSSFMSDVDIESNEKKIICAIAEQLNIDLSDGFFDLGNLCKDTLSASLMSGPTLNGTTKEKEKYELIENLYDLIIKAISWMPIEKAYESKKCVRLAVKNCGKAVDEDVEISLTIPKTALLTIEEFPELDDDSCEYLLRDSDIDALFGIGSTAEYNDYYESVHSTPHYTSSSLYGLPGYTPDYKKDYLEKLANAFCYAIYNKDDNYIVKLKVDYIKHNTTVAFPTILLLKDNIKEIPYEITSKNNPEIVIGTLIVKTDG